MLPTGTARRTSRTLIALLGAIATFVLAESGAHAIEPKKIFNSRCTACHTYGHGVKVGPDLKGVNTRRDRQWVIKFVRSSSTVIKSGDKTATELFEKFKGQRMPDWSDLSPADVSTILDWFAADGPDQKEPDERDAALATEADLARARALFDGSTALASGGLACASCHRVEGASGGGTLGPDLTGAYGKYRDRALTLYLKHPCTPRQPEHGAPRYLTPEESFALKGYLRQASLAAARPSLPETKKGVP
jgi:mono/diheme cytochrome c family protein